MYITFTSLVLRTVEDLVLIIDYLSHVSKIHARQLNVFQSLRSLTLITFLKRVNTNKMLRHVASSLAAVLRIKHRGLELPLLDAAGITN